MLVQCLLILLLLPAMAASEAYETKQRTPMLEDGHIVIIAVALSVVVVAFGTMLAFLMTNRKLPLVSVLLTAQFTAVILAGVIVWFVTFSSAKESVEDQVGLLLQARIQQAGMEFHNLVKKGEVMVKTMASFKYHRGLDGSGPKFPTSVKSLISLDAAIVQNESAVTAAYFGMSDGRMVGAGFVRYPVIQRALWSFDGLDNLPNTKCSHNINCRDTLNTTEMCTKGGFCSCAELQVSYGCDGVFQHMKVQHNVSQYCQATCQKPCLEACAGPGNPLDRMHPVQPYLNIHFFSSRSMSDQTLIRTISFRYDPRTRPWYMVARGIQMTPPYIFVGSDGIGQVGFTITKAVLNGSGGAEAVYGVDFTTVSVSHALEQLTPTENSMIYLAMADTRLLLAASINITSLVKVVETESGKGYELVDVLDPGTAPLIRRGFEAVARRYGDLTRVQRGLLVTDDLVVLCAPLVVYNHKTVIITVVPQDDVFASPRRASTVALVIALATSIGCGLVLAGVIAVVTHPLQVLAFTMREVSWMRLKFVRRNARVVHEIWWMQQSFCHMVNNLIEYKQYLPDSVLCAEDEDDDESSLTQRSDPNDLAPEVLRVVPSTPVKAPAVGKFVRGLKRKMVTVLVLTVKSFLKLVEGVDSAEILALHGKYLEMVAGAIRSHHGVVDGFSADYVHGSFNAVTRNSSHRSRACSCALRCVHNKSWIPQSPLPSAVKDVTLNCAIAGGDALCGNMGCTGLKRFSVLGVVNIVASYMERLGRYFDLGVVCDENVAMAVAGQFEVRRESPVLTPLFVPSQLTVVVHEVVSMKFDEDEWMYRMTDNLLMDYHHYNIAVTLMYQGDYDKALEALEKSRLGAADKALAARIESLKEQYPQGPPTIAIAV